MHKYYYPGCPIYTSELLKETHVRAFNANVINYRDHLVKVVGGYFKIVNSISAYHKKHMPEKIVKNRIEPGSIWLGESLKSGCLPRGEQGFSRWFLKDDYIKSICYAIKEIDKFFGTKFDSSLLKGGFLNSPHNKYLIDLVVEKLTGKSDFLIDDDIPEFY